MSEGSKTEKRKNGVRVYCEDSKNKIAKTVKTAKTAGTEKECQTSRHLVARPRKV